VGRGKPPVERSRAGARQPERFNPAKAAALDDESRFSYLAPKDVLKLLSPKPGALVVDFGTGTGAYALALGRLRPDLKIAALDEQKEMLAKLKAKLKRLPHSNVVPVLSGTAAERGLAGQAAGVLALNVLHELGDQPLRSLSALLAPGGRAAFIDWNAAVKRPVGPPKDHVYSPREASRRLKDFGFKILRRKLFAYHYAFVCGKPRAQGHD